MPGYPLSAVDTERGGMDKHHGRSVEQETGAALATERCFPAASYSMGYRAYYATHARILFAHVLQNSAEDFCTLVLSLW